MTLVSSPSIADVRKRLAGSLVLPGDPGWDDARQAWNLAVDQRPELVVLPTTAEDVVETVAFARAHALRVAVQGTGHGAAARGDLSVTVLVNMRELRGAELDPVARVARVAAGALWEDVVPLAAEHGLAALHGSSRDVGVVGYTLGGGVGWLARRYGLAANSVVAVELVTPDGRALRADADQNADLFWAIRGGGGNFGVVTSLEFRLYPVGSLEAGWLVWPWERSQEVLEAWAAWAESMPDDVTSVGRILQLPPIPEIPEALRGRQLVVVEAAILGDSREAAALLRPLRDLEPEMDTFTTIKASELSALHQDPYGPTPGIGEGGLMESFPPSAVAALAHVAGPGSGSPLLSVEVRHLGGALDRIPSGAGALTHLDGRFLFYAVGVPVTAELGDAVARHAAATKEALAPWGHGREYLNFAESPIDTHTAFDADVHRRLCLIRAQVDPDGLIRANHPIPAASTPAL